MTIITGAGSGLGRSLAASLASAGRSVALFGRREERLRATQRACMAAGAQERDCPVFAVDVTDRAAATRAVRQLRDSAGRIDALVNNAAVARFCPIEQSEPSDWNRMMETNVLAPAAMIRNCADALREAGGVVVNVGSIGGVLALPGRALYGASKAALSHLTRSLARELAPHIRVNAVLPGAIDTEMHDHVGLSPDERATLRSEMVRTTPLGRLGTVADVVPWIEMLLGPAGRWVTGSLLVIDGGRAC